MNDKQLIATIKELKQVKPREEWVLLTKNRILGNSSVSREADKFSAVREALSVFRFFSYKPALATVVCFSAFIGLFGFVQSTVPGDMFFPLKKITENAQVSLSSKDGKSLAMMEIVNKRLDEIEKIGMDNDIENLAVAKDELQASLFDAMETINASASDPVAMKRIAEQTQKFRTKQREIELLLGIVIGDDIQEVEDTVGTRLDRQIREWDAMINGLGDENDSKAELQGLIDYAKDCLGRADYVGASEALQKAVLGFPRQ